MSKEEFIEKNYPHAKQAEAKLGVPALFALAQSALESGWGKHAPNNMLFGIKVGSAKDFGGWKGDKQLITTTEYGSTANLQFPYIYPDFPIQTPSGKWEYRIKDYFRAYPTPLHAFLDWGGLLSKASRYAIAMRNAVDPYRFADEVAKAGYATDPRYASKVKSIMRDIEAKLPEEIRSKGVSASAMIQKAKKNLLPILLVVAGAGLVLFTLIKTSKG